jgi:hypothetical protein
MDFPLIILFMWLAHQMSSFSACITGTWWTFDQHMNKGNSASGIPWTVLQPSDPPYRTTQPHTYLTEADGDLARHRPRRKAITTCLSPTPDGAGPDSNAAGHHICPAAGRPPSPSAAPASYSSASSPLPLSWARMCGVFSAIGPRRGGG